MKLRLLIPAIILLLAGVAVLLYGSFAANLEDARRSQEIAQFQAVAQGETTAAASAGSSSLESATATPAADDTAMPQEPAQESERLFQPLYEDMVSYNETIYENGQSGLVDAWSYEQPIFRLSDYGIDTEIVGYLEIPAMEQTLPIYLGASMENLSKGVAVMGQTSMPIGGDNTNCVIAGHRGNGNDDLFREIELLEPGDSVYLTNLWETLTYTVESTRIITPDDLDVIKLQEGRELLTLITCHPRVGATHRYVVFCTRDVPQTQQAGQTLPIETAPAETQDAASELEPLDAQTLAQAEQHSARITTLEQYLPYAAIPLCLLALCLLFWPRKKRRSKGGADPH